MKKLTWIFNYEKMQKSGKWIFLFPYRMVTLMNGCIVKWLHF